VESTFPLPKPVSPATLKNKILRPATTSNYECWFPPPSGLASWLKSKNKAGIEIDLSNVNLMETLSLNCMEASLPGSSLATMEKNDDYTGVTERIAYRRQYDDRADFTFNVDHNDINNYNVILYFELWKQFVVNEQFVDGLLKPNYSYRVNFPYQYQTNHIVINKFERDFQGNYLQYKLFQAYPIAINSMPIGNDTSQILKCTVSFNYTRYTCTTHTFKPKNTTPARP
jgi:hypothetical protein